MSQRSPTELEIDTYASHYVLNDCQSSAFRATYPDTTAKGESIHVKASQMHSSVKVQLRIEEFSNKLRDTVKEEFKIDAVWVLKQAVKVYDRCMQAEPILVRGAPTGEYKFEPSGANKALEIIGKHIDVQAFNENLSIKTGGEVCPWGEIKAHVDPLNDDE